MYVHLEQSHNHFGLQPASHEREVSCDPVSHWLKFDERVIDSTDDGMRLVGSRLSNLHTEQRLVRSVGGRKNERGKRTDESGRFVLVKESFLQTDSIANLS